MTRLPMPPPFAPSPFAPPLPAAADAALGALVSAGLAGLATVSADGVVLSREGRLGAWLPEPGRSAFSGPVLFGLEDDFAALRDGRGGGEPLVLPGLRLADRPASPRCCVLVHWDGAARVFVLLTTTDQVDRPIDHWVLQQKREQRLLEERLIAASRELERMNADLRTFSSIAAHDLQAPLRQITAFAGLLRQSLAAPDGRPLDHLEVIEDCAGRLTRMIAGLLGHARLSSEQVAFETVDLAEVLAEVCCNLALDIRESGGEVAVGALPRVAGSRALLVNLFQNLVGNALRYRSPERPLRVVVSLVAGRDGARRIAVCDNGVGVPAPYAEAIFAGFVRVPESARATGERPGGERAGGERAASEARAAGVGLGLGLCRRIAELHGWRLALDTGHLAGARFCLSGFEAAPILASEAAFLSQPA